MATRDVDKERRAFSRRLTAAMASKSLEPEALSRRLTGVQSSDIEAWIDGMAEPSHRQVTELERALRLGPGDLSVHLGFVPAARLPAGAGLVDAAVAAEYLGVSVKYMYRLTNERRIGFVKLGNKLRFRPKDLDAFIEANRTGPMR